MFTDVSMLILTGFACLLYGIAFVLSLCRRAKASFWVFGLGWIANGLVVIGNYVLCGHPPFGNMYHVLVFWSLCFLPLYCLVRAWRGLGWTLGFFAFASFFPLLGTFFMERNLSWQRVPALQSPWFVPHVLSYMVSYATAAVAAILMLSSLWSKDDAASRRFHDASQSIMRVSLPLMTFGLWSGALWAEEAWGIYWSWDPKETWALITWLLYLASFHVFDSRGGRKRSAFLHLAGFAALLVTFLVVNLLPKFGSALHSYVK